MKWIELKKTTKVLKDVQSTPIFIGTDCVSVYLNTCNIGLHIHIQWDDHQPHNHRFVFDLLRVEMQATVVIIITSAKKISKKTWSKKRVKTFTLSSTWCPCIWSTIPDFEGFIQLMKLMRLMIMMKRERTRKLVKKNV